MRLAHFEVLSKVGSYYREEINIQTSYREHLEWRSIEGYENQYEVSNYGDFHILPYTFIDKANRRITRKEKFIWFEDLKEYGGNSKQGHYLGIHLGGMKKSYAHILAAKAFCPNPYNKPEVNHINGNTKCNYCGCKEYEYQDSNLEWVTRKENMIHASNNGLIDHESTLRKYQCMKNREKIDYNSMKKSVIQIEPMTGDIILKYSSIKEASQQTGINYSTIHAVINKKDHHKTAGGFNWIYESEYDPLKDYKVKTDQYSGSRKIVIQKTLAGEFVAEYQSIQEACKKTGFSGSGYIGECCSGKRKNYKKYLWEFKSA
jgi:hypothetical protein